MHCPTTYTEGFCPFCNTEMVFITKQISNDNDEELWFCPKCKDILLVNYEKNNEEQKVIIKNLHDIQSKLIRNDFAK